MSDYVNHAVEEDRTADKSQKPVYKIIALIAVDADSIAMFDKTMTALNNRWAGRVHRRGDDVYVGWISYTARGANMHDIRRRFEGLTTLIDEIDRVFILDDDE